MIVCQCVGVSDSMIRRLIAAGASSVAEITRRCGAGRCCAPCREEIASLLYHASTAPASGRELSAPECA
ncbi:MAG TPA: (2Fe-2S)-binding protein [Candidatus Margulisiibacteriota bacterium]|nr:(2Fe-2S)-binding protein [Candidatus Margulisiibacteriota bacterium]